MSIHDLIHCSKGGMEKESWGGRFLFRMSRDYIDIEIRSDHLSSFIKKIRGDGLGGVGVL
jgi:hypothetical protein